jgi:crotonobetainyl-CoA:carnitine CoA-transferase CaiB-like acyl-CoA transferase
MTLPLEGIKILDLTRLAPGPYCTMILADLGADVLKIEEPGPPTGRRAEQAAGRTEAPRPLNRSSPFNALNRNKKSMGLNLKNEEARKIFHKLAETTDVVVEEFRPGVTKRLGIDYDTLSKINPRIIYCAVTGYGQDGPYRDLVGHDINYISHAGALGIIGHEGGPPAIPHNLLADFAGGGMHGVVGVMAALLARERTGRGQIVDIAMMDGVVSLQVMLLGLHYGAGETAGRGNNRLSGKAPHYNVYETKDGKYISIGSNEPWFFANLCKAIGHEEYITNEFTKEKHPEMIEAFAKTFKTRDRDEWFEILTRTDICVGKVYDHEELENDPQVIHREMIVEIDHPTKGKVKQVGIPMKLSETPGSIRSFPPALGEHTDEVLTGLGYSVENIERLRSEEAIK